MKTNINRRHFLRGAGAMITLPALESIAYDSSPSSRIKKPGTPPKRLLFMSIGFGVTNKTWFPNISDTGSDYKLSKGLKPLERHKKEMAIIQGCQHQFSNEAHWGSTFWLTGANRYAVPGQKFNNTISADQVAARQFGQETRFSSIQIDSKRANNEGHGPGLSLAWDEQGKPVAGLDSADKLFHALFSDDTLPLPERQKAIAKKRSVLDAVLTDAKRVQRGLSKGDTDKLDEYFQGIRDIETRLAKDEKWLDVPKTAAPLTEPKVGLEGVDEIKVMYDLMVAAIQTDNTRVLTYRLPGQALLNSLGYEISSHNVSHYSPGDREEASQQRDLAHSKLLAGLMDKLKAVKEPDGSSLFDHTLLAFGSNIRSIHHLDNCPTLIAGGNKNLKLGQHIAAKKDTPLNNVWLSMLQASGVKVNSHGDSSGTIKELMA
ncbi:DUF1552 domain-containing protein [Lentisphaera marina]|uniref:DUF1552 domain-containing protein n=1 Tax=Lentisphaera marina TaxID=1111041 RepID=UPI0023651124|nr:DUF1552 domain-containing protein [Lentisphaera marina]MDD7985027.1 DUF1552 domain-containing protein [Lentisphaera marina]